MKNRTPENGELVHINSSGRFLYPHGIALYLDEGTIVIPSHLKGWLVTKFEGLDNCRPVGHYNVKQTHKDESGNIIGYDFLAYDEDKPVELNLRKNWHGVWHIKNDFNMPSWARPKKDPEDQ